jgi:Periplasmic copper-binding protein (NosD)
MRRLLGLVLAALAATLLFALSLDQAASGDAGCTIDVTQSTTLSSDTPCVLSVRETTGTLVLDLGGHRAARVVVDYAENAVVENGKADEIDYAHSGTVRLQNLVTGSIFSGEGSGSEIDHATVDGRLLPGGCELGIFVAHSDASITDSSVKHCGTGLSLDFADATVRNSVISDTGVGLETEFGSFEASHNAIIRNDVGVALSIGGCLCTDNDISHNGNGVLITADNAGGTFTNNRIDHSRQYGVVERPPLPNELFGEPPHVTFNGNHVWWSGARGIESIPDSTGSGNWVKHSGLSPQCVGPVQCSTTGKPKR